MLKLGIVILNYNDWESTVNLVSRIAKYKNIDQIVVVDNCSNNDSYLHLKLAQNECWDLIQTKKNNGYAHGNNQGIKYLLNKYCVDIIGIANPDVYFEESLINFVKEDFEKHKEYAIITGVQKNMQGNINSHAFWDEMTIGRLFLSNFRSINKIYEKLGNTVNKQIKIHQKLFSVSTVEGCLFFINAADMVKINGFDEGTFLYMEEDILSKKVKNIGKKIGIDPMITFTHLHSTSIDKTISYFKKIEISFQSKRYFLYKYLTKSWLWNFLFNVSIKLAWVEQIFIVYPYFKIKALIRGTND